MRLEQAGLFHRASPALALPLLFCAGGALAQLIVVQDLGGASALPYYQSLNLQSGEKAIAPLPPVPLAVDEAAMLPVVSNTLSAGKVEAKTLNASGLVQPVFVVGSDALSLAWLRERAGILRQIGAVGLAVEVPDTDALAAIRKAAQGMTVLPVAGDDLAQRLGVTHYPFLLTTTGLEQ